MSWDASAKSAMRSAVACHKPKALGSGSRLAVFAPASPASETRIAAGVAELKRLGFSVEDNASRSSDGYFAASALDRRAELLGKLADEQVDALVALRGGYGSNYILDEGLSDQLFQAKGIIGFSDLTSLQIFLWQRCGWVTFYGPMIAAGLDAGAGAAGGYDEESFHLAVSTTDGGWKIPLRGSALAEGEAEGRLLGGAMTLLEATMGTSWELDTRGAILVLEDRAMKPYQVDRVLMHLKQASKLSGVRGIVLGEFPECETPVAGSATVRDVCARILGSLGVPIVFGAAVGHTPRPMLTLPLGVQARLSAKGEGLLEILEPAVVKA
jgi:muramoyltetrapeptide carboxypeptidase